jgi:transposase InsO family protein
MDILGPLPQTKHGNCFLLVVSDRYSKVTKTEPLRKVTALSVARAFCDHWAYVYGPPASLLTGNCPQFTDKFFQAVCGELGIQKVFTTAYHPQTKGQIERNNRTILASLRGYVAARQDNWDGSHITSASIPVLVCFRLSYPYRRLLLFSLCRLYRERKKSLQ